MATKEDLIFYEGEREVRDNLVNRLSSDIDKIERDKKDLIQMFLNTWKIFNVNDVFNIQWPNEKIPLETYKVIKIRWGISNDFDAKSDILYDCIKIVKMKGRPSTRTTAISQTSIINSKNYEKCMDIL